MNTHIALRATIGGVPIILEGDWGPAEATYAATVSDLDLDINRFLRELLRSFGVSPPDVAFPPVRLEVLHVECNNETGWLSVAAQAQGFELFFMRQMKKPPKPYALGMRATRLIRLRDLPWLDQYAAEFPELNLGIQNLGFVYASGPERYPFPCTDVAPDEQRSTAQFNVVKGGYYAWITQNIIQPEQTLWIPPLTPAKGGGDERGAETDKARGVAEAKPEPGESSQEGPPSLAPGDAGAVLADSAAGESKISWLDINKTLGPFTLARVGGSYADNKVTILLDASVSAAGLTLSLYGLGLRSPIYPIKPEFTLSGMSLSYARGPVELSGGLVTPNKGKTFFGEILVRTKGFGLSAIGGYYRCYEGKNYKSLFVFGMLDLPLGGPPAFFVTGLAAGCGFNSKLNLPPVSELNKFVLVQRALPAAAGDSKKGKADVLETLMKSPSIEPEQGENWLAAGVRFTSFQMIQSFALITVSFGTRCEIALLGRSQMSVPPRMPGVAAEAYALAFAEVDLKAVIEPGATGDKPVLAVDGIVAAGSYVFAKGCRLTGGFAFYVWASGEFVVTFGGYHPRFVPPDHYPAVGRLGFVWPVSGNLHAQGELYFALTGSAIMAGFAMQAVYQSGPVVASFFARADLLLSWKPFHYEVTIAVQIRIALRFNLGLLTTNLSYQVGVDLQLHGPPFGGVAHVNLDVISFSIPFGSETSVPPKKLTWREFATTFLPPDNTVPASDGKQQPLVQWAGVTGGLIRESKDPVTEEPVWIVNPRDLEITTHSGVPATKVRVWCQDERDRENSDEADWPITGTTVGILPMEVKQIESVHSITINRRDKGGNWKPYDGRLAFDPVTGKSPKALYGDAENQSDNDRLSPVTMIDDTLLGITIKPRRQDPAHTAEMRISELLLDPCDPVTYQGFVDPPAVTDKALSLADNPDLAQIPEEDL